nr:hypothetical protein [Clostridia bacterium]
GRYIMKSIIKEIFYGERGNCDNYKTSEEYSKILEKVNKLYKEIKSVLTAEKREEFETLCKLQGDLEVETADEHFIEGVKIGILLGIEACN